MLSAQRKLYEIKNQRHPGIRIPLAITYVAGTVLLGLPTIVTFGQVAERAYRHMIG